jgi:Threonine synthase
VTMPSWSIVTHSAPDAALASCVDDLGTMDVVGAVASVMRVEGGGRRVSPRAPATRVSWPGVIRQYRDRLPAAADTPVITLGEGATPLLPAPVVSARTGCEVYLKVEGANPTASFKDRGMTVAVSMAAAQGARR